MKIGIDIIKVERILNMSESAKLKVFTEAEISYATNKHTNKEKRAETLAGIFACKEAYLKALGVGVLNGVDLKSVEIIYNKFGQPEIVNNNVQISISHDAGVAVAVALIP